jgi:hypothetical protein
MFCIRHGFVTNLCERGPAMPARISNAAWKRRAEIPPADSTLRNNSIPMHNPNDRPSKFMWSCLRRESIASREGCEPAGMFRRLRHRTSGFYLMRLRQSYHREGRNATFFRPEVTAAVAGR